MTPSVRRVVGVVLLVVAGTSAALAVAVLWLRAEVLDPEAWTDTTSRVLADPLVRADLSETLAETVVAGLGVEDRVGALLPFPLDRLAEPLGEGATDLVARGVDAVVASDAFAGIWEEANRAAWSEVLRALRGDGRATAVVDGALTLELGPALDLVRQSLAERGLPGADELDLAGLDARVVLVPAPELERLETFLALLDVAVVALPVAAAAFGLAGVVVVRRAGLGLIATGAGVLVGAALGAMAVRAGQHVGGEILEGGFLGEAAAGRAVELVGGSATPMLVATAAVGVGLVGAGTAVLGARRGSRSQPPPPAQPWV